MSIGQIVLWFFHGIFAGGFGGVAAVKNNVGAGILFLLFMSGAIYGGANMGWQVLIPDAVGFALGFGSVMSNKDFTRSR